MSLDIPTYLHDAADKARDVVARVRPGALEGRGSLPIRRSADDIRALWETAEARAAVLEGLSVSSATLALGAQQGEWGTVTTLELRLGAPVPGVASRVLAGKAVRRLKALAETGEVPTTERNPSARPDAGAPA